MKVPGSQLTPFVRSDAVGAILAESLSHPDREFSLAELGRRTGVSSPVVHREVGRLVESGILRDRHEGRNRLVRADGNRIRAVEEALSGTSLVIVPGDDAVHLWNHELTGVQPVELVFDDQSPVTDEEGKNHEVD